MTRILIHGSKGRMGQALITGAARIPDAEITGKVDLGDSLDEALPAADVVIDFTGHRHDRA